MAYWLGPGGSSAGCHGTTSTATSPLSDDVLTKQITIGSHGLANVIRYKVAFGVPTDRHQAGFEAVTGYMPPDFARFWSYDPISDLISPAFERTGGQQLPLVVSTANGNFALGVLRSFDDRRYEAIAQHVYGHWDFTQPSMASPTIKWNSYFHFATVRAGDYSFTTYIVIGTLGDIRRTMRQLCGGQSSDINCSSTR
jgi:hypothetical protein